MKTRRLLVASALALASLLVATQASAQTFIGASIGQSKIEEELASGLITSGSIDGSDTAFELFGGYMFNRHLGIEGAYVDLGEVTYSGDFFGDPVVGGKVEVMGFSVAALGSYPLSEQFSLFGKIGLFLWEAEASGGFGRPFLWHLW
jgi:OmpA-OmpF porin, OOP family